MLASELRSQRDPLGRRFQSLPSPGAIDRRRLPSGMLKHQGRQRSSLFIRSLQLENDFHHRNDLPPCASTV